MDGEIPGHVFRNIIKQYGSSFPVTKFSCYKEEEPPDTEGEKICMDYTLFTYSNDKRL